MNKQLEVIKKTRSNFLRMIEGLSIDQLNHIPRGFNNNIVWHLGHLVYSQQVLCYKLGNTQPHLNLPDFAKYGKGTKPEAFISLEELQILKSQFESLAGLLLKDYSDKKFSSYTEYTTSYGTTLGSIEDAIAFVSVHEGLHFGYAMALKRLV